MKQAGFVSILLLVSGFGGSGIAQQVTGQDLDKILERADKLLDDAKAGYENARSRNSVEGFVEAGFKLEEARFKYLVIQELGSADKQKITADRLKAVNQLGKLLHDAKVALGGSPAEPRKDPGAAPPAKDPGPAASPPKAVEDVLKKAPVPDAVRQREAEKLVRDVFKEPYAKKTPADRKALARLLLNQAARSQDDPAALWVLYREAQDLSVQTGDVKTILEAVQGAAGFFDVDALALKYTALSAAAKTAKAPEDFATLAEALQALIDDLVAADRYEAADQAAALSVQVSRKSNDVSLSTRAAARSREVADAKILYQSMKGVLEAQSRNPDDPGANLEIGRFLCFVKGSWDLGLRFLVKSSDAELKELAQKEVAAPLLPSDRVALADGWFDLVEKEKSPLRKGALLTHARGIYESAQPGASTLLRAKIEKRLGDIDAAALAAGTVSGTRDRVTLDLGGGMRMELIYIKPGVFAMGGTQAPPAGDDRWADERPAHRVTLTKGYYLGKTEVTRGQFAAFVKATGYKTEAEREGKAWGRAGFLAGNNWLTPTFPQTDDHPATCISWNDAKAFCDWAAKKTGRGVRLPMEAEWEYACRAGANTRWSFGDDESAIGDYAWTDRNSGDQTHPVGQKKPNAWGLYDMHGNVWEWCLDGAGPYSGDAVDPAGPFSGVLRCRRGGSCFHPAVEGRAAFRGSSWVGLMASDTGFRAALTP